MLEKIDNFMVDQPDELLEGIRSKLPKPKLNLKQKVKLKRIQLKKETSLPAKHPEAEKRTIYVGNVNANTKRAKLEQFFCKYGKIESVRIRGIAAESFNMSKKEAICKGKLHPDHKTVIAYIRFTDATAKEKALEANCQVLDGLHLRVDNAFPNSANSRNSVFLGNLPFETEDEDLWNLFSDCGKIESVRVVRSSVTGAGKGFGFVTFKSKDSLELALHMNGKSIGNRPIRVKRIAKKTKEKSAPKFRKRKCAAASLAEPKENVSRMKLSFMKRDKPRQNKDLKKKRERKNYIATDFTGTKTAEDGKLKKRKPRRSKAEKKKLSLARILQAKATFSES